MAEEEIEVKFRLDAEGRTALLSSPDGGTATGVIDYTTRVIATHFVVEPEKGDDKTTTLHLHDELLLDCEIADCGLMPRTFWVPATAAADGDSFQPRCTLEQMARDIFRHHTANCSANQHFDPSTSGAEWWVQLRPSPETTGRYSMLQGAMDNDEEERNGISFHWDKDEDLRLLSGGNIYVHPHLSTVTYLTSMGAPTFVAEGCRIHNLTGEWIPPSPLEPQHDDNKNTAGITPATTTEAAAFISWPAAGKHLCFDGRYLHAAPFDLQEPGAFANQCQVPKESADNKVERRRYRRYTFLVNIWLNHRPFNVNPFPDPMIDKLSGYYDSDTISKTSRRRMRLSFSDWKTDVNKDDSTRVTWMSVSSDKNIHVEGLIGQFGDDDATSLDASSQQFTWPIGECDLGEVIQAWIPLELVRSKANKGENLRIQWLQPSSCKNNVGMCLVKQETREEPDCKRLRSDDPAPWG
jgi:hypothetical protein